MKKNQTKKPKEIEDKIKAAAKKKSNDKTLAVLTKALKDGAWVNEAAKVIGEQIKKNEAAIPVRRTPPVTNGMMDNPYFRKEESWYQSMERSMQQEREMEMQIWGGRGVSRSASRPSPWETYNPPPPQYGMERQYQSNIICPVCGSNTCGWWYGRIQEDRAGDVLKDMMNGVFKGDGAYMGGDQEYYYQQRREQFYDRTSRQERYAAGGRGYNYDPSTGQMTEDIDYEIVQTERRLRELQNKKMRELPAPPPPQSIKIKF